MDCYICFDSTEGFAIDEIIECNNHPIHKNCFRQLSACFKIHCSLCSRKLSDEQLQKLRSNQRTLSPDIIDWIRADNADLVIAELQTLGEDRGFWFKFVVRQAIESSSIKVLQRLKPHEATVLHGYFIDSFHIELFSQRCEMSQRWVLNAFDPSFKFVDGNSLDSEFISLFAKYNAYRSLFAILVNQFPTLCTKVQVKATSILYRAHLDGKWQLRYIRQEGFGVFFRYFITSELRNDCHVWVNVSLECVSSNLDDWESFPRLKYLHWLNKCSQCKGSHIWDAIEFAVKRNNLAFLQVIVAFQRIPSEMPFSMGHLVSLVSKTTSPKIFSSVIERAFKFNFLMRQWLMFQIHPIRIKIGLGNLAKTAVMGQKKTEI